MKWMSGRHICTCLRCNWVTQRFVTKSGPPGYSFQAIFLWFRLDVPMSMRAVAKPETFRQQSGSLYVVVVHSPWHFHWVHCWLTEPFVWQQSLITVVWGRCSNPRNKADLSNLCKYNYPPMWAKHDNERTRCGPLLSRSEYRCHNIPASLHNMHMEEGGMCCSKAHCGLSEPAPIHNW